MRQLFFLLIVFSFLGCKDEEVKRLHETTEVESSHEELLSYEKNGYRIILNEKPVKIANLFLDRREIKGIDLEERKKLLTIVRNDTICNVMNLLSLANNLEIEKQMFIIDGYRFESKDFEKVELELSAVQSVRVKKDTVINGKKYNEIRFMRIFNNATTANSRLAQ